MNKKGVVAMLRKIPGPTIFWTDPETGQAWTVADLLVELKNKTPVSNTFRSSFQAACSDIPKFFNNPLDLEL
jgi:hypothetical protein